MIRHLLAGIALLFVCAAAAAGQQAVTGPHGTLRTPIDCGACHTPAGWSPLRERPDFAHASFPLTGRHAGAACASCHLDLRFDEPRTRPTECGSCHVDVHEGRIDGECADCHNTTSFRDAASLDQHARRGFPLDGAHLGIACVSCHTDDRAGAFTALDATCVSCHRDAYRDARSVDHGAAGLPLECTQCHTTARWAGASFDHAAESGFALTGGHADAKCSDCHVPPGGALRFDIASPADCAGCHRADYDREHAGTGFPLDCADCHDVATWDRDAFDHARVAPQFLLEGRHLEAACTACHAAAGGALLFDPAPAAASDCVSCHRPAYDREHTGSDFPLECATCHTTLSWEGAVFEHETLGDGFPLLGSHARAACSSCHVDGGTALRFAPPPAGAEDCIACHRPEYDERHAAAGFPVQCLDCHTVDDWLHAAFDHAAAGNGFALVGRHEAAACADCHVLPGYASRFSPEPDGQDDCVACHRAEYDREHAGGAFPDTCGDCHSPAGWDGASFDHALAGFALEGAHAALDCARCHRVPGYDLRVPTPSGQDDCVACHRAEYDTEHTGTGFPTTCLSCHGVDTWAGAQFDHDFPIFSGPHANWSGCQTCHTAPGDFGVFTCLTCHEHSQSRMDDKHREIGGYAYDSPTCLSCHPRGRH